jgi:hypothetical protein
MNECSRLLTVLCLLFSVACGGSIEAPESTTNTLHAETAKVLAIRAPRYTGTGSKADALQYINSDVKPWLVVRKTATQRLITRLEAAGTSPAPGRSGVALMHADIAKLLYSLSYEFIDAGDACTPVETRNDASAYHAYLGALVSATLPDLDRAIIEAQKCVETAQPSEDKAVNECQRIAHEAQVLRGKSGGALPSLDGATRL